MFLLGMIFFIATIVILFLVLQGYFNTLPDGLRSTISARFTVHFTRSLRDFGTFGKVVYWAAPFVLFYISTAWGGIILLGACIIGYLANKKFRLTSPPPATPPAYTPSGGDGL